MTYLAVEDLSVEYEVDDSWTPMVQSASFRIEDGDVLGIVGESGCGKTTLSRGILRLLPPNGRVVSGTVDLDGVDLLRLSDDELRTRRWDEFAMVFQGAMNVLNPVHSIGRQLTETFAIHRPELARRDATEAAQKLLQQVGIEASRMNSYPHELSGGMKQRVGIAMAMALQPKLVIADEPTTALDVVTQDSVLSELTAVQEALGFLLIIVSHDMGVIAENCTQVAVMYAGRIVEIGTVLEVFDTPSHPYTQGLLNAIPRIGANRRTVSMPGSLPRPGTFHGCAFQTRCPFGTPLCAEEPSMRVISDTHSSRCHYVERRAEFAARAKLPETWVDSVRH